MFLWNSSPSAARAIFPEGRGILLQCQQNVSGATTQVVVARFCTLFRLQHNCIRINVKWPPSQRTNSRVALGGLAGGSLPTDWSVTHA